MLWNVARAHEQQFCVCKRFNLYKVYIHADIVRWHTTGTHDTAFGFRSGLPTRPPPPSTSRPSQCVRSARPFRHQRQEAAVCCGVSKPPGGRALSTGQARSVLTVAGAMAPGPSPGDACRLPSVLSRSATDRSPAPRLWCLSRSMPPQAGRCPAARNR